MEVKKKQGGIAVKKGINIWSFPPQPLAGSFELAKKAGFEGVEVAIGETGEITLASTEKDLAAVRRAAADNGIALYSLSCGLCWDFWLNADDKTEREKAKDMVRRQLLIAKELGCDTVLVLPGCVTSVVDASRVCDYAVAYDRSLSALSELKETAEQLQVAIGLENVWNKFLLSPLEMRDFIDKVNSPFVGAYFDVGNALLTGYPEQWIRILGDRIKKVHFKDFRVDVGNLDGFVDLLAGDCNWPAVMQAFSDVGYDGWVSAEMIPNYKYHTEAIIYNTSTAMDYILGRK